MAGRRPKTPGSGQKRRAPAQAHGARKSFVYLRRSPAFQQTLRSTCTHDDDRRSLAYPHCTRSPHPRANPPRAPPPRPALPHRREITRSVRDHTLRRTSNVSPRADRVISRSRRRHTECGEARRKGIRSGDVPKATSIQTPLGHPTDPVLSTFLPEEHLVESSPAPTSFVEVFALPIELPKGSGLGEPDVHLVRLAGRTLDRHLQIEDTVPQPEEL